MNAMDATPTPHPDACFDADWLALRTVADSAARAPALEARATAWLRAHTGTGPLRLIDLGTGSGANPRHLAPRLPGPQSWTLIDHDTRLLAHARAHCADLRDADGHPLAVETQCLDLGTVRAATLAGSDLVCASALLDLMSANWLEQLAEACAGAGCALLITLSVDGSWRFLERAPAAGLAPPAPGRGHASPPGAEHDHGPDVEDADDRFVRAAFNDHQRRDKGLGAALGPDAAPALAHALAARGFAVECAPSPWRLDLADPKQAALASALIDGWRDAALAQCPQAAHRISAWHERRRADCQAGAARPGHASPAAVGMVEVGHIDLFATPPSA
ncbi:MAG: class I SAM-dependent methyltransferase [Thauera sp.]